MAELTREKRDLVLAPGTYAYMQDSSKGGIKTYVGPTVITPTAQERPVVYDAKTGDFRAVDDLEEAIRKSPIAVEGFYLILLNPASNSKHPGEGTSAAEDLDVGRRVNIPGPVSFALWPGQAATHVRGHHLRSNQYLLVRVYNENEAHENWHKAVIRTALDPNAKPDPNAKSEQVVPPPQLPVGKLLIIRGDEVSFYIPPTGISVVQDGTDEKGKPKYVRDAMTLERLEYCILIDEDGNKRYEQGPSVVFPEPTERFVESKDERSGKSTMKFRAIELNEIQGLHVKVIADYEENNKKHWAGEELFITGKDTAIYYPREEHSAIKYDGKSKHFATAIPAGEARYVMNRLTGDIHMVKGPAMLLPDPRIEIIVRRALSDNQVTLWYPDNHEALVYNQNLRNVAANSPTTRAGAVSEGEVMRGLSAKVLRSSGGTVNAVYGAAMEQSLVSGEQDVVGDAFSRGSTYTQPRSITLDTKYQGVPTVDIWTGYAVKVVAKSGKRRVESGPTSVQLAYDESLEVVELSTGKPKTTDKLLKTVYLRVENNKVTDIIGAETSDHVKVKIYLSYRVNFLPEHKDRWFDVENYVKFLCDHARSILKSRVRKSRIEDFYGLSTEIVRDTLLGIRTETGEDHRDRPGMFFPENGMHVIDVEVLNVEIGDERIRQLLENAQHNVVKSNIDVSDAMRGLEVLKRKEAISRETFEETAATQMRKHALDVELATSSLAVALSELGTALRKNQERQLVEIEAQKILDINANAELERNRVNAEQHLFFNAKEQEQRIAFLMAEAEAAVRRFSAVSGNFSEALLALSNNETLQKVAEAWSIQRAIGGESISDALQKVFAGSPLAPLMKKLTPGNGVSTTADAE